MEQAPRLGHMWIDGWSTDAFSHVGQWLHALPRATLTRVFSANPDLIDDVARMPGRDKVKTLSARAGLLRALSPSPNKCYVKK